MNSEELTALVLEDIPKFEQLTNIHLTEDDLRIISMNRFASLEQSMARHLTESEYRHLLEKILAFDYIEQELLKRPLTKEERIEQEELTLLPYEELFPNQTYRKVKLTHAQIDQVNKLLVNNYSFYYYRQILYRRAELVDQYDVLHSISPSIKLIEDQLNRSLSIDEKKRLTLDDYSMIKPIKNTKYKDLQGKTQSILPITASLLELVEHTQDGNLLEHIQQLETDIGRSLTKQEISMAANGDISALEKLFDKPLPTETIKSMYNNRFTNLTDELNRNLTDKEIRDVLSGKLSGIENALGRQLVISLNYRENSLYF
jgi:hypothetical protein